MNTKRFSLFLRNLGFSEKIISEKFRDDTFTYTIDAGQNKFDINYVYTPTNEDIFQTHLVYWNKNNVNVFIAVSDDKTYIINAKEKPNLSLSNKIKIHCFDYGINTVDFEKEKIREISKEYIDASYFFDFVIKNQKSKQEVDKHLLLDLIALRNDLLDDKNEHIIHLLILRCLFLKYLEDRGIYSNGYLVNILDTKNPQNLIEAFDEIVKINGDIFKYERLTKEEIKPVYLEKLAQFFKSDYRTKQLKIFPYQFNQIPIQLISHVYEAFLKGEEKKGKGIYYTPSFVVNFMLSHTLREKLIEKQDVTVFDPAVGSGAFLVESFRMIINSYDGEIDYTKKKEILQNQLFGIDIDPNALQIATFSLYLALLETEKPEFIREQIEKSYPILPTLIGNSLIEANSLTDNVFENRTFDCIVTNPPWSSVQDIDDPESQKERQAIGEKGEIGTIPEYKNVSDYERSQAFLLRVKKWSNLRTIFSLVVKNSIFLNDNANPFREDFLKNYQLNYFYELSNYNKILFKKRIIGKINGANIELGSTEPCAILVFELSKHKNNTVKYISPKLNDFSENFECIHFTQKDINGIEQNRFITDDLLWRVLVNGDFEDYKLIKEKLITENGINIECRSGFQPKKDMKPLGKPVYKDLIKPGDFQRYVITNQLAKFNWNQKLRRKPDIFFGKRIIFPQRPLQEDNFRLRCIGIEKDTIVHRDDILCIKPKEQNLVHNYFKIMLGILNSKLIGYILFHISSQWGKEGEMKRPKLRNLDIEKYIMLPHINYEENKVEQIRQNVEEIENLKKQNISTKKYENLIDELVFDLYNLFDYEKEIIREFYKVRTERTGKSKYVTKSDLNEYVTNFTDTFGLMLAENYTLKASYKISANVGTIVCFTIVDEKEIVEPKEDNSLEILHFVKRRQLQQAEISKILNEDKVKIYDEKFFYIIKSNLFKDWTKRQAIKDAKEEIGLLLSKLPETHEP
jgi:hypothetical protein